MPRTKLIMSITIFVTFLLITSAIKNKTRIVEKQISYLYKDILKKEKKKIIQVKLIPAPKLSKR